MDRIERYLGRIFLILVGLGIGLFCVELVARLFFHNRTEYYRFIEEPRLVDYVPFPYVMGIGKPRTSFNGYNKLGFKGVLPAKSKAKNEYRIFVIGGSTVEQGNPSWPELLNNKFHREGLTNVQVYNFGTASSVSAQDLIRIIIYVVEYKPDLIISYSGGNDIFVNTDPRLGFPHRFAVYENAPLVYNSVSDYPLWSLILFGTQTARIIVPDYFTKTFVPSIPRTYMDEGLGKLHPTEEERAEYYVKNLEKSKIVSEAYGAQFLAVFQPMRFYSKNHAGSERHEAGKRIRRFVLEQSEKVEILDATLLFQNEQDDFWMDMIHPNNGSLDKISDFLFQELRVRYKL